MLKKNVFIYTLGITILLPKSVLAVPLLPFKLDDFHDQNFHVSPGAITTTHRYHDDGTPNEVAGSVTRLFFNPAGGPIAEFDVTTTVINNSKKASQKKGRNRCRN